MMNQKQATINAILSVLRDRGVDYELNGDTPVSEVITPADRAKTRDMLFTAFRAGDVSYKESFQPKLDDDSELKKYVGGLTNNWIRKAKELNCNQAYTPKNPGSRAGSTDPQVKEMRKLLKVTQDSEARDAIKEAITTRLGEIRSSKMKVEVDMSVIPEELRALLDT